MGMPYIFSSNTGQNPSVYYKYSLESGITYTALLISHKLKSLFGTTLLGFKFIITSLGSRNTKIGNKF